MIKAPNSGGRVPSLFLFYLCATYLKRYDMMLIHLWITKKLSTQVGGVPGAQTVGGFDPGGGLGLLTTERTR